MKMDLGFRVMWMILMFHVLCCCLLISHSHGIVEASKTLKDVEDLQKLKLSNKPAVKIIKSISGEEYECVDFYKQPGLDHPSMKNHTFHYKMRMTSYPEGFKMQRETISSKTFGYLWENGVGCPIGTVPQLRVTKDNLLSLNSFGGDNSNPRGSWNNTYEPMAPSKNHHFAVIRTSGKPKSYNGAAMNIATFIPMVKPDQFSSGRLHLQIGNEFMQAGWIVYPRLYHYPELKARLFVFTDGGGHACYNSVCPSGGGMILVRQDLAPGIPLEGGGVDDISIAIVKDQKNGSWWLFLAGEEVGFWPSSRFKESSGTAVEWGGEVFSGSFPSPPMGNGRFPVGNPNKDSCIRLISIFDGNYKKDDSVKNTERFSDNHHGYKVTDTTESWWSHTGHILFYGGPGNI